MKAFFYGLEDLFVNYLFAPFDFFRFLKNWWLSSSVNWIFFVLGILAFTYWMLQLKKYNDKGEEDKSITSHSYL